MERLEIFDPTGRADMDRAYELITAFALGMAVAFLIAWAMTGSVS